MTLKKTYKITGMDCSSCAMLIEGELEEKGIKCSCSYPKQILEVELNNSNNEENEVFKTVQNLGYGLIIQD